MTCQPICVSNSVIILQSFAMLEDILSSLLILQAKHIFDMYLCPG